jgi:hypothetical protein
MQDAELDGGLENLYFLFPSTLRFLLFFSGGLQKGGPEIGLLRLGCRS